MNDRKQPIVHTAWDGTLHEGKAGHDVCPLCTNGPILDVTTSGSPEGPMSDILTAEAVADIQARTEERRRLGLRAEPEFVPLLLASERAHLAREAVRDELVASALRRAERAEALAKAERALRLAESRLHLIEVTNATRFMDGDPDAERQRRAQRDAARAALIDAGGAP